MDTEECIRFANENPVARVVTTSGDQPRLRPLQMWFADMTGSGTKNNQCRTR